MLAAACATMAQPRKATCNLIYIGDSITEGVLHADKSQTAPPVLSASMVGKMLARDINFRNCGAKNHRISGCVNLPLQYSLWKISLRLNALPAVSAWRVKLFSRSERNRNIS